MELTQFICTIYKELWPYDNKKTTDLKMDKAESWSRKWQATPVFLPGISHGQRSLVGYNPRGGKRVWHDLATKQTESKKKVSRKGWGHIERIQ